MNFRNLQSHEGLVSLNTFLADKSYIERYHPTQADVVVFEAVKKAPSADLENALRWYNHISSFNDAERQKFEGQRQAIEHYGRQHEQKAILVAKSEIILDVKPWDDQTNMEELEKNVRSIELDGLLWGASRLVPLAYGIKILQIICVVEDDKVGTDILEERITAFEDHIQSVDIAAFRKI